MAKKTITMGIAEIHDKIALKVAATGEQKQKEKLHGDKLDQNR